MSSPLVQSLLVFGQVYFLNTVPNIPPNGAVSVNSTLIPNIDRRLAGTEPLRDARRDDYVYTPGIGAYKVHTQVTTWNEARKICLNEGGHLAIINSVAESEHVAHLARTSGPYAGSYSSRYVFLGFHDLYRDHEFVTLHGTSLIAAGFNDWEPSEPSKIYILDNLEEHCGSMSVYDGKLNDVTCTKPYGFVCELPYV